MYHIITPDLKLATIRLWDRALLDLPNILHCCNISRATFYRVLKLWRETGDVVSHAPNVHHGTRILDATDVQYLCQLVAENPDYFLDELLHLLQTNRFISVHYSTIHKELVHAGVSGKRLQVIAAERNEDLQAQFII